MQNAYQLRLFLLYKNPTFYIHTAMAGEDSFQEIIRFQNARNAFRVALLGVKGLIS